MDTKIHVGCGPHNLKPGWTNVDIRDFRGVDRVLDVTQAWPFKDVEFIYGEHFIEHLPLPGILKFLGYAGQSLKKGGVIRLTTPNLEWVMKSHYPIGDDYTAMERVKHTFGTNRAFHGWGHQFLFDAATLEYFLNELGFGEVTFCDYGESAHADLEGVEQHGGYRKANDGLANLLIVEASKLGAVKVSKSLANLSKEQFQQYVDSGH